MAAYRWVDDL